MFFASLFFLIFDMVQLKLRCSCHTVMDRRVGDLLPWQWMPMIFTVVILVTSICFAFICIEVRP